MKTLFTLAILALSPLCIAQKTIDLKDFKNVAVGADTQVTLVKSNQNKLVIESNDEDEEVNVNNEGGHLAIEGDGPITLYFKGEIESIAAGSDSKVWCKDEIKAHNFSLAAGSDSEVELKITADQLTTAASSDAQITLSGKVKKHDAVLSSDAKLDARGLETEDTDINASSDAEAVISAKGTVNAIASSDAEINIYGTPKKVNETESSDAKITVVR